VIQALGLGSDVAYSPDPGVSIQRLEATEEKVSVSKDGSQGSSDLVREDTQQEVFLRYYLLKRLDPEIEPLFECVLVGI
jgi:hypothetical protein